MNCNPVGRITFNALLSSMVAISWLFITYSPCNAVAIPYAFRVLYDQGSVAPFGDATEPSLNDAGVVAFKASLGGNSAIVKGNGGPITVVAMQGAVFSTLDSGPSINNSGTVAFTATQANGADGLYLGNGGATTKISNALTQIVGHSINNSGTVVFNARNVNNYDTYKSTNGGAPVLIIPGGGDGVPDINNAGVVTWGTTFGVHRLIGNVTTTVVDRSGQYLFFTTSPSINSAGKIAYHGYRSNNGFALGIYTGSFNTTIASSSNGFEYLSNEPVINDKDAVFFEGGLTSGKSGLFVRTNTTNDLVLAQGMPLFGSTLEDFRYSRDSFNNNSQFAFSYYLADGRYGIGLASPVPEPASAWLIGSLMPLIAWHFARRTHRKSFERC